MSGGHFDYRQYYIDDIVHELREMIESNNDDHGYAFSDKTIEKFKIALDILKQAAIMTQRIDWLVSGDDGEETFHKRWDDELKNLLGGDL